MSWVRLLKRVFDIDIEHCPHCGGTLKIIAAIEELAVIIKILAHLGLPTRAPPRHLRYPCSAYCPAKPSWLVVRCLVAAHPTRPLDLFETA